MGCGKLYKTKSQITMTEEKSIINKCKNAFKWFKGKGKESKETKNDKHTKKEQKIIIQQPKVTPVAELLEKLEIEKRKEKDEEEDEMGNFSRKLIDVDQSSSINSHSSLDSGYTDKDDKDTDELTKKLKDLKVESQSSVDSGFTENAETGKEVTVKKDGETKEDSKDKKETKDKKKTKTVVLHRGPDRHNRLDSFYPNTHPYAQRQDDYKQTTTTNHGEIQSQINKHTLSGGRVIVNDSKEENLILAQAVIKVDQNVQKFSNSSPDEQEDHLRDALELVKNLNQETFSSISDDFHLPVFSPEPTIAFDGFRYEVQHPDTILPQYTSDDSQSQLFPGVPDGFPTPPRSEYVPSPSMSDLLNPSGSPSSFASPPYGLSNPSPLPLNPEWEQFGIVNYEPIPEPRSETDLSQSVPEESPRSERRRTLKYYKDMQKEIANQFNKKECCQNQRSCKEIFQKHMQKLSKDDRRNIFLKVAKLDLKDTYGVLCYILMELSQHTDNEDMQMSIFELICEKVLAQNPELFFDKFGLNLIKLAVLRCFARPLLTRYLVQCVRVALKAKGETKTDTHIFDELDAQGDNLLHACVRLGDVCADALSELVRKDVGEAPLFDIHHHNSDGFLPLHLACTAHSACSPRALCVHALLEHGGADLWRWDRKGGESSVHLAVNSGSCDLALVMQLFHHVGRKEWKRLAHYRNRGLLSPLEYARTAARSPTRTNYPVEVLEFLQKCR